MSTYDLFDQDALADRLASEIRSENRIVFLLGSAVSLRTEEKGRGVPGTEGYVQLIREKFADNPQALLSLDAELSNPNSNRYQSAFRFLLGRRGPHVVNEIIRAGVLQARRNVETAVLSETWMKKLEMDCDGWVLSPALKAIGRLSAERPKSVDTVLTTNFDPLVEIAVRAAGGPVRSIVLDSDGALNQSIGEGTLVVHLHGYWYQSETLHVPFSLAHSRPRLSGALRQILASAVVVVVGYGGWNDVFTRSLIESVEAASALNLIWCFYEAKENVADRHALLLQQLAPAISRNLVTLYAGIDAHALLPRLASEVCEAEQRRLSTKWKTSVSKEFEHRRQEIIRGPERGVEDQLKFLMLQSVSGKDLASTRAPKPDARMPGAEIFDLGSDHRVVTQVVKDGADAVRFFWYVGTADQVEYWLDQNTSVQFVLRESDSRLEAVPLETSAANFHRLANPELSAEVINQPMLRHLKAEDWELLGIEERLRGELLALTYRDFQSEVVTRLLSRLSPFARDVIMDVLRASNTGDLSLVEARLGLIRKERRDEAWRFPYRRATDADVVEAISLPVNAEQFITFNDPEELKELFGRDQWADWMLFLHEAQRDVVQRVFNGPARIRGVSGSGKTSIVVHRARALARRYRSPVVIVTLTKSLSDLIGHLLDALCGVERNLIRSATTQGLATDVLSDSGLLSRYTRTPEEKVLRQMREEAIRKSDVLSRWKHAGLSESQRLAYISDELTSVRENYLPARRPDWLDDARIGRRIPLPRDVRVHLLEAIKLFEQDLTKKRTLDQAAVIVEALRVAKQARELGSAADRPVPLARCILIDEAQDLSLNELRLLKNLCDPTQPDGLFLSSDAAQRIYKRRYSLNSARIDVSGRAFVFKKNYRNTRQILAAARELLQTYDIAELDEDAKTSLIDVDYSAREGARPEIVRFDSVDEEVCWVAGELQRLQKAEPLLLGAGALVIGPDRYYREAIDDELRKRGLDAVALYDDVVASSAPVKVSTIETAKGHEFSVVFIVGMIEGLLPRMNVDEEVRRDAGRLYVAMTRARERITLTWNRGNGTRASRFLTSIMHACKQSRVERGRLISD